jgi:hypothetical protein
MDHDPLKSGLAEAATRLSEIAAKATPAIKILLFIVFLPVPQESVFNSTGPSDANGYAFSVITHEGSASPPDVGRWLSPALASNYLNRAAPSVLALNTQDVEMQ